MGDFLGRRDVRWYAAFPALLIALGLPFFVAAYLWAPTAGLALALLFVPNMFGNSFTGPTYAVVQTLMPDRTRALASAVLLFIISLIGFGLGPFVVGLTSDLLRASLGVASLRRALGLSAFGEVASIILFLIAARGLRDDFEKAGAA